MSTPWDHLRAALIVAHLAAITIAAVPTPEGELDDTRRQDPEIREIMAPWTALVQDVGLADDEDGAVDWLFDRGQELVTARRTALGPVIGWLRVSGNSQSWRMFGAVPAQHARFEVHGQLAESGEWVPLYVENTPYQWNALLLNQSRVRAMRSNFSGGGSRGRYNAFARRIASQALDEHEALSAASVHMRAVTIPPAARLREQGGLTQGKTRWTITVTRP